MPIKPMFFSRTNGGDLVKSGKWQNRYLLF